MDDQHTADRHRFSPGGASARPSVPLQRKPATSRKVISELPGGVESSAPPRVLEGLFVHQDAITRHLSAPMLREREAFLAQLLNAGHTRRFVAGKASTLLQVVRFLPVTRGCSICEEDISVSKAKWAIEAKTHVTSGSGCRSRDFTTVSRGWVRFLGILSPRSQPLRHFEEHFHDFVQAMQLELGYLPSSIRSCASSLKPFFAWISLRCEELSSITPSDIDAFLDERRSEGRSQRTIVGHCRSMRTFFGYAERRGWSHNALSRTIKAPSRRAQAESPRCPSWSQVRRMVAALDSSKPSQCRAKAILLLAAIYGLRRSEITRLMLEDLDWCNEVLTVRRSKGGRVQQFPIQLEVGEAIIRYLREVRPASRSRHLFLTLHSPFRPALNLGPAVRKVLYAQKVFDRSWGLHAFRHACATELLRKGTSLQSIADFLGHRSVQSVSIYAHCDIRALRKVAAIDMSGILCG